ncbi:hypothetical protein SAMN05216229_101269 [Geopseudomonas sagittaria]|uniref:Uncharacterized protein n=1 Tax=Geopseudomonas sagittaria TaxID=1135990 RepID=A0A1I5P2F1_9GAMM|nr:hypothetical protein [Pseudomonas sagittaria]MCM2329832.1 hypothetical protein [Pseudomonas sagittaria]SFP27721.1 hypothetical protein SAMN05216229_101269 [Pseudomonas sagittaria]
MNTNDTLSTLYAVQADIEEVAAKLLRDAQMLKTIIKRQPLSPELTDLLAELRRDGDNIKTRTAFFRGALVEHADAEHADRMRPRRVARCVPGSREDLVRRGALLVKGA